MAAYAAGPGHRLGGASPAEIASPLTERRIMEVMQRCDVDMDTAKEFLMAEEGGRCVHDNIRFARMRHNRLIKAEKKAKAEQRRMEKKALEQRKIDEHKARQRRKAEKLQTLKMRQMEAQLREAQVAAPIAREARIRKLDKAPRGNDSSRALQQPPPRSTKGNNADLSQKLLAKIAKLEESEKKYQGLLEEQRHEIERLRSQRGVGIYTSAEDWQDLGRLETPVLRSTLLNLSMTTAEFEENGGPMPTVAFAITSVADRLAAAETPPTPEERRRKVAESWTMRR
eukprot:g2868.t1